MGKRIVSIMMFVCLVSYIYAQDVIEIQAGINFANLSNPGNLVQGAKWSTMYGAIGSVSTRFQIMDNLYIAPGLRFVQKGTKSEWSLIELGNVNSSLTNNYLELPIYMNYVLIDNTIKLFLIGGPAVSYLLSSRSEGTTQLQGNVSSDSKKDYKSTDASIDLGLSSIIPLKDKYSIIASAIYSYGLVKISSQGSNEKTRNFIVLVGVSYSLK